MTTACSFLSGENHSPSPVISFIKSQKGKPLLVSDEYIFKLNKTTTTSKYWICAHTAYSAKIHTNTNNQLTKRIAIQRRIDCLDKRYYDGLINVMEYLNGLSLTVAKRKK